LSCTVLRVGPGLQTPYATVCCNSNQPNPLHRAPGQPANARTGRWRGPGQCGAGAAGPGAGTASPPTRTAHTTCTPRPRQNRRAHPTKAAYPNKTIQALRGLGRTGPINPSNTAPWTTRSARATSSSVSTAATGTGPRGSSAKPRAAYLPPRRLKKKRS
jgi:hypothetical protein